MAVEALSSYLSKGDDASYHDQVYDALAEALTEGVFPPGQSVSLRTLAGRLNVSPMPVREAVRRLIAEKALELQPSNKRLRVPSLSEDRLHQLAKARSWVEPELAAIAAVRATPELVDILKEEDDTLMVALSKGDVEGYMKANHAFHFQVYKAAHADLFYDMARTLWLQTGPFMRVVFNKLGTVQLPRDHHQELIGAFAARDAETARKAMAEDIEEGMDLMLEAVKFQAA
ncbi:GntR family transcriptional regulator [Asticcacaulis machinosus]|uniref:GntR family transcriptional regulator n=1 Tax=Asticcacaulis machinosus TaxID=2984211 RepID=A0ABT5HIP2_9CAUL|nr:GntR family transcriptional regulator [Asticcacaulis machinosus]MDC7676111.1 GntR family transcriptional regulator [Asticcacaulis machinosus]